MAVFGPPDGNELFFPWGEQLVSFYQGDSRALLRHLQAVESRGVSAQVSLPISMQHAPHLVNA